MKKFEFEIAPSVLDKLFPPNRVKTKVQILNILLEAVRYSLSYKSVEIKSPKGKMVLVIDKMSRLFFFTENKAFSIVFPFLTLHQDDEIQFSYENIELDPYLISNLISVITDGRFMDGCSIDLSESLIDYESENENFWLVLRELLLYEDGYIRYDYDINGFNEAKEKGHEQTHPLNHLDLFYTNRASFKIGIENKINIEEFIDILNIRTDCKYIKNWR